MKNSLEKANYYLKRVLTNDIVRTTFGFFLFLGVAAWIMLLTENPSQQDKFDNFFHALWYAIVTVTTVGYGDMSPTSTGGQVSAIFIIFVGIAYSGILTGNITTWLVERNRRKQLGQSPLKKLDGKFLVCGWKSDMSHLLKDILTLHDKKSDYLVLLNNMNPNTVNELRQDPQLRDFYYFRGDDTSIEHLENARAATADRVLVLADQRPGSSPEEKDFQSVLTCLSMSRINPEIYLISEILLPKFRRYLDHARVEEIVLSSLNERSLLCNMAMMSGMYNLFKILFDISNGLLDIRRLPLHFEGRPFQEVKEEVQDVMVIGLLENIGNLSKRKTERLAQIQKSPSIKQAIEGLADLKKMESNTPVLNPPPDYLVKGNSALIVLKANPYGLNKVVDQYISRTGVVQEGKLLIESNIQETLLQAGTWREYFGLLASSSIELVVENGIISKVISGRESYLLKELDVPYKVLQEICQAYISEVHAPNAKNRPFHATPQDFLAEIPNTKFSNFIEIPEDTNKGRLFILGWKPELPEMLHFLIIQQFVNSSVEWKDITVVANVNDETHDSFHSQFANFDNIFFIRGDFADHDVLKLAKIETATKVLILAETESGKSFEEIDAQTVLATMMVAELNKRAYKVAEILDKRYEGTLENSKVEEIICLDEFSRRMLTLGSHGKGITNILREFINMERTVVSFLDITPSLVGQPMEKLYRAHCLPGILVLGILEEAGNMYVRKSEKIRQAQFNPAIEQAVKELIQVKDLQPNQVKIAPSPDYIIPSNAKVILLHSSDHRGWEDYMEDKG
ncbi:MAG: ion channel [SAR324 cluster bacterium]|nr:ion channel [SAR324 cluster bacterium]